MYLQVKLLYNIMIMVFIFISVTIIYIFTKEK